MKLNIQFSRPLLEPLHPLISRKDVSNSKAILQRLNHPVHPDPHQIKRYKISLNPVARSLKATYSLSLNPHFPLSRNHPARNTRKSSSKPGRMRYTSTYTQNIYILTLWRGSPGGAHASPASRGSKPTGSRVSSALRPSRARTDTHSSWQTSCASRGHLQLVQFFLETKKVEGDWLIRGLYVEWRRYTEEGNKLGGEGWGSRIWELWMVASFLSRYEKFRCYCGKIEKVRTVIRINYN